MLDAIQLRTSAYHYLTNTNFSATKTKAKKKFPKDWLKEFEWLEYEAFKRTTAIVMLTIITRKSVKKIVMQ